MKTRKELIVVVSRKIGLLKLQENYVILPTVCFEEEEARVVVVVAVAMVGVGVGAEVVGVVVSHTTLILDLV